MFETAGTKARQAKRPMESSRKDGIAFAGILLCGLEAPEVARYGLGRQPFSVLGGPPNEGAPRHKGELGSAELLSLTGSSNDTERGVPWSPSSTQSTGEMAGDWVSAEGESTSCSQ